MSRGNTKSGGVFLPIGIFAGLAMGAAAGEPVAGVLIGAAGGAAAVTWLWLRDRRRTRKHRKERRIS